VIVPTEGEYELLWTIEPGTTCEISDTIFLRFTDFLTATVPPLPDTICGLSTLLEATDGFPVGQWTASPAAGVVFDDPTSPQTNVQVPDRGAYEFVWAIGMDICRDTALVRTVFVNPLSNVPADFTVDVFQGKSVQLDVDTGVPGARYTWSPDSTLSDPNIPNPIASPFDSENYTVTITTGTGEAACNAVVNVTVNVVLDINPPNVFTPNGDGVNDLWEVPLLNSFETARIQIFNRWGDRVFESTGYNVPWDGTFNGNPVANSTYYYVIELNPEPTVRPLRPEISGSITVTR
ncbi:MAG: gliding motility-associated C-terminal domain-containing protein, partial [Bacteroidota bacterium]